MKPQVDFEGLVPSALFDIPGALGPDRPDLGEDGVHGDRNIDGQNNESMPAHLRALYLRPRGQVRAAHVRSAAATGLQALAVTHRVATPAGWRSIADLATNDLVFGINGTATAVTETSPVYRGLPCFEVSFDDGQKIRAAASNSWTVQTRNGHDSDYVQFTATTEELATMKRSRRSAISIPLAIRESPSLQLPIDPYLFGYWLGDGYAANGAFAVGNADVEEVTAILQKVLLPYEIITSKYYAYNLCHHLNVRNIKKPSRVSPEQSLFQRLRTLGVLYNKHVPELFLLAGTEQRRSLMQGMIDSDGNVTSDGQIKFTNTNRRIIDGFLEVCRSLGYKPSARVHTTSGWVVSFQAIDAEPVARIQRKATRVKLGGRIGSRRYIQSITPIEPVPVKSVGFATQGLIFQVEGGIATHGAW
ncbi:LAGLIDADG family homing endonuclease [Paenarthrobacter nicotinovorans]|uniref:LAGLIDADG family homing endonuclease n=1 Tax=Paenarthrobacter nicotinovorans TaxID=29320 RepID=UPI003816ABC2